VRKLLLIGLLSSLLLPAAENRIAGRISQGRLVSVPGSAASRALAAFDRGPADAKMPMEAVTLLLRPDASLDGFLTDVQNPGSPNYHHWVTPEQFADRFGLTQPDIDKIAAWLTSQGLQVTQVARGRHWITVSGTAGVVGRAFHTEIRTFNDGQAVHYANATDPQVPEALAGIVAGFAGLDDLGPKPLSVRPRYTSRGYHYLSPDDFATIYNLKPLYSQGYDGTGQSIMVIGQTAVDLSDIRLFRTRFGLPSNDPQIVLTGPDPGKRSGDMVEADLDLEWAGAIAPQAKVIYVYAGSVLTSTLYGVDQNLAPVLTLSYGGCEQYYTPAWRYVAQQAAAQGITWMVASGDQGAAACDYTATIPQASKGATVTWPAGIPEIIAVGGTTFNEGTGTYWNSTNNSNGGSVISYIPETAWNDSDLYTELLATGGGASVMYTKPSWQRGPGVPADGARDVPDVSFAASPAHDPYLLTTSGLLTAVGGTSASSPAFAGIVALLNQYLTSKSVLSQPGLGNLNPALYRLAQASPEAFHDVTTGDNRVPCVQGSPDCHNGVVGYAAGNTYDQATGLGSIDAATLVQKWNTGTATTLSLSTDNLAPGIDDSVNLTAVVHAGGSAAPTGNVTFTTNYTLLGTGNVASGGSATVNVPAARIAAASGLISAVYSGDSVYDSSSADLRITVAPPASGSGVVPTISPNPVYQVPSTGAPNWAISVTLKEIAGVATTLTGLNIDGDDYTSQIGSFFKTATIPAKGSVSASILLSEYTPPFDSVFHFTGADADGRTWKRDATVRLLGPAAPPLVPSIALTGTPQTVQRNPQADPSCQWVHQLSVQEQSGYSILLSKLVIDATDVTGQIQAIFGTTRLAPFGSLEGTICWNSTQTPGTRTVQLTGQLETGGNIAASTNIALADASAAPAAFSSDRSTVSWQVAGSSTVASSAVTLKFAGGSPHWSASVGPANRTSSWLSLSPASGSGSGTLNLQASTAGLSPGAYRAIVAIQASDAVPQLIEIPVTLTVAASDTMSIAGAGNGASFRTVFAPGMLASVFGTSLAPVSLAALYLPLPLSLGEVSATVNGITAPLYYVSPGQINLQIPYEVGAGSAVLAINNKGSVASLPILIAAAAPGIFTDGSGNLVPTASAARGQTIAMYITGDGDVTPWIATGATPPSGTALSKLPKSRLPLSITVGGSAAKVVFDGITSGLTGVTQVNLTVPSDAPLGAQQVVVTVGGVASPAATLTVTQ
jgi:uncharacterized protein (TIGR03437 family)